MNHFSDLNLISDATDLKTDDLTTEEMGDLFKTISEWRFQQLRCIYLFHIKSWRLSGGILGVDGDSITVKSILRRLNTCSTLVGKPKLFFTPKL